MNSILIWLIVALLGVGAATGSTDSATSAAVEAPSPTEARQSTHAFANREQLPPCGTVDRSRGARHTRLSPPAVAWGCLSDALGRQGAELMTIDQRPRNLTVHTVYRARGDGQLEIWTQRTRTTPYRPLSGWRYRECTPTEDLRRQPCPS